MHKLEDNSSDQFSTTEFSNAMDPPLPHFSPADLASESPSVAKLPATNDTTVSVKTTVSQQPRKLDAQTPINLAPEPRESCTERKPVTAQGLLWPAEGVRVLADRYFAFRYAPDAIQRLIDTHVLTASDGKFSGMWILSVIDHWDNQHERLVVLTDQALLFVKINFINEEISYVQRVSLKNIASLRIGNLVAPNHSVMPERDFGGIEIIWGDLEQVTWINRWNPLSNEVPYYVIHHHPCYYSAHYTSGDVNTAVKDLILRPSQMPRNVFDADTFLTALQQATKSLGLQLHYENIVLNSYVNPLNLIFNQSNLGFAKDRNGVNL